MGKLLKMLAAFAAATGVGASAASAQGTSNTLPGANNQIYQTVGTAEITSILTEFGIGSQVVAGEAGGPPVILASDGGGGRFIVSFINCTDMAAGSGCNDYFLMLGMPSTGVTYEDLNQINGNSDVARAVYDAENQIVLFGAYFIAAGGVGRDNVKLNMALYFDNVNKYFESRSGTASTVSFSENPGNSNKSFAISTMSADIESSPLRKAIRATQKHQISTAIHNKWSTRFPSLKEKILND